MATGDAAVAAGMDVCAGNVPANTIDTEITKTRDYIAGFYDQGRAWGNLTGKPTLFASRSDVVTRPNSSSTVEQGLNDTFTLAQSAKSTADGAATGANNAFARADEKVAKTGDTMSGHLFLPNSTAATASWQVAYINGDGRVCRGSSSQRYKKFIGPFEPQELGDIFPALQRYKMRADGITPSEEKWRYGYIAEQLAEQPDLAQFVVWRDVDDSGEQVPDSIDFVGLLLAQVAQLHQRVQQLEAGS